MEVVFDSDVLIPMILPASKSTRLFERLINDHHTVATSQAILDEVADKLRSKTKLRAWLNLADPDIEGFLQRLPTVCLVTAGIVTVRGVILADPKDDKVLAAALEANADYIVSEDRHLRSLGNWLGVQVMNRDGFMSELDRLGVP